MQKVAIVVPLYKVNPSALELLTLQNNFSVLREYPKYIIAPRGFNGTKYGNILNNSEIVYLKSSWFKSLRTYNKLMLKDFFYKQFIDFEYILILQPDALVFRNELIDWCEKGYSYVGAPWFQGKYLYPFSFHGLMFIKKLFPLFNMPRRCFVGNGGLSLRNVADSLALLQNHYITVRFWSSQEDYFWAYYFASDGHEYSIPTESEASKFSLEMDAEQYYAANDRKLPFGCHAYEKYCTHFWKEVIPSDIGSFIA